MIYHIDYDLDLTNSHADGVGGFHLYIYISCHIFHIFCYIVHIFTHLFIHKKPGKNWRRVKRAANFVDEGQLCIKEMCPSERNNKEKNIPTKPQLRIYGHLAVANLA